MVNCPTPFQKLLIEIPSTIKSNWQNSSIANLFDGNFLKLIVNPSNYTPISEGGNIELTTGYSSTFGEINNTRLGFRLRVIDPREDLRLLIDELRKYTYSSETFIPITINDYLYFANKQDKDRGYRIRLGVITGSLEEVSGAFVLPYYNSTTQQTEDTRLGRGFSFVFMETDLF